LIIDCAVNGYLLLVNGAHLTSDFRRLTSDISKSPSLPVPRSPSPQISLASLNEYKNYRIFRLKTKIFPPPLRRTYQRLSAFGSLCFAF